MSTQDSLQPCECLLGEIILLPMLKPKKDFPEFQYQHHNDPSHHVLYVSSPLNPEVLHLESTTGRHIFTHFSGLLLSLSFIIIISVNEL